MFRFHSPQYLWLLVVPALLVLLFVVAIVVRKMKLRKIGDAELVRSLIPDYSLFRRVLKFVLMELALVSMIIAFARPQFGSKLQEVKSRGSEIIVALDVSKSMLATDVQPNRMEAARKFIGRLLSKLQNDKLGLVLFSGEAFVQMPLTDDVRSARLFLSSVQAGMLPVQGTALGAALDLAAKSFSSDEELAKIVILITDGENHEDDAIAIANKLKEKGFLVYAVGMGSVNGAPIPQSHGGFLKDRNGNVVTSMLDEKTLVEIARITDGIYVRAGNSADAFDKVVDELATIKKGEIIKQNYSEYNDIFSYFAVIALVLLIIEACIAERKNALLKKIDLFKNRHI